MRRGFGHPICQTLPRVHSHNGLPVRDRRQHTQHHGTNAEGNDCGPYQSNTHRTGGGRYAGHDRIHSVRLLLPFGVAG